MSTPTINDACGDQTIEGKIVAFVTEHYPGEISPQSEKMLRVCLRLWAMLNAKNRAYGNSALDPVRIFSKAEPDEQLRVRIDDKISRLMRGNAAGEDVEQDLAGYLVILFVAKIWGRAPSP